MIPNSNLIDNQKKIIREKVPDELYTRAYRKYGLDRSEVDAMQLNYRRFDSKNGLISFHDMMKVMKQNYYIDDKVKEQLFKELGDHQIKGIDFEAMLLVTGILKKNDEKNQQFLNQQTTSDYVDAFVALGGNADQTGKVYKSKIIQIIKNEFQLTFDVEQFLDKIEGSNEELDYPTFCLLFDSYSEDDQGRGMTKTNSVLSLLSHKSTKSTATFQSLKVRYRDFEKFLEQMEAQEEFEKQNQNAFNNQKESVGGGDESPPLSPNQKQ